MNEGMLTAGQVIRYGDELWRVDYVNDCRARIVPLNKRHVHLNDGREFDADRNGVSISPNSFVEIVTDIEQARTKIELEDAERELRAAKAEVKAQASIKQELEDAEVELAQAKQALAAAPRATTTGGWHWVGPATFKPGSMGEAVSVYIQGHPGLSTAEIVAAAPAAGAVAACVSRFFQAGLIKKS